MDKVPAITLPACSECGQCPGQKENGQVQLSSKYNLDDFFVDTDIVKAKTLPYAVHTDPEIQKFMLKSPLYMNSWRLVPERPANLPPERFVSDELQVPRNYYLFKLDTDRVIIYRDDAEKLNCYSGVCTHAGGPVLQLHEGIGKLKQITTQPPLMPCIYHGAQFQTDGKHAGNWRGVKLDDLTSFHIMEWNKFFFVSIGEPKIPFKTAFAEIDASIQYLPLNQINRRAQAIELRGVMGSPLLHAQNYLDGVGHGPLVHVGKGGLVDKIEMSSYTIERYPNACLSWAYAKPEHQELGFSPDQLPARFVDPAHPEKKVFALWWYVPPGLTFNVYPWGLSINFYKPSLEHPNKTDFEWCHYPWDMQKYERREEWLNTRVHNEDVQLVSVVAEGVASRQVQRGKLVPGIDNGVHWLNRRYYEWMFGQPTHHFST